MNYFSFCHNMVDVFPSVLQVIELRKGFDYDKRTNRMEPNGTKWN